MAVMFFSDPATGVCALFDDPGGGGQWDDINAPVNRPAKYPANWLSHLYFHSSLDYMEVSHGPSVVAVSHSTVAASSAGAGQLYPFRWQTAVADHALMTHSLGYIPIVMVVIDGNVCWPGMPIQTQSDGGARFVTPYATTSEVRLSEYASVGSTALTAQVRNYTVLVFRQPPAAAGNVLMEFDPADGSTEMGRGKFDSVRRYLQVAPGGTPFGLPGGRSIDLNNGAMRAARPDGVLINPVRADLSLGLARNALGIDWGWAWGSSMGYGGSFSAPTAIQVKAP